MPYDGDPQKFETPAKPDVFSLESLIAWLETRDPDENYKFAQWRTCLLTTYFGEPPGPSADPYTYRGRSVRHTPFFEIAIRNPHSYGAALSRARKLLAERNG